MQPVVMAAQSPGGNKEGTGIYLILCRENGRGYVGQALHLGRRLRAHRTALRGGKHYNVHLQRAWNAHGEAAFDFVVLEHCPAEMLDEREGFYAASIDAGLCFNLKECGDSYPRTDEHKQNLSRARRTWKTSSEHMEKLNAGRERYLATTDLKAIYTDEVRRRISEKVKGRRPSEKVMAALLAYSRGPRKPEHGAAISAAKRGTKMPRAAVEKTAAANRGRPSWNKGKSWSDETKAKMSAAKQGKPGRQWTDEQKQKAAESARKRWARHRGEELPDD